MKCRGCSGENLETVFEMEPMPLAGSFASSKQEAHLRERFPLTWLQCQECRLVQVAENIPDEILYRNYNYASSTIPGLCDHFDKYAEFLIKRRPKRQRVLEMGCNDGVLLRRLPKAWKCVGVDPSDIARKAALDASYEFINKPFSTELKLEGFDLVLASNCLAHVSEIQESIEAAAQALKPKGEFWIEVHDLQETLRSGQWDTIYHEHKVEYDLASLVQTVQPHGFFFIGHQNLPLHGGLLRVGFEKSENKVSLSRKSITSFDLLRKNYSERRTTPVYEMLLNEKNIAYGASGRATVWFNQLPELTFEAVIDDSPARQWKFVPGVGWPIIPWEERPSSESILLTAWNYAKEIRAFRKDYNGRWYITWAD